MNSRSGLFRLYSASCWTSVIPGTRHTLTECLAGVEGGWGGYWVCKLCSTPIHCSLVSWVVARKASRCVRQPGLWRLDTCWRLAVCASVNSYGECPTSGLGCFCVMRCIIFSTFHALLQNYILTSAHATIQQLWMQGHIHTSSRRRPAKQLQQITENGRLRLHTHVSTTLA